MIRPSHFDDDAGNASGPATEAAKRVTFRTTLVIVSLWILVLTTQLPFEPVKVFLARTSLVLAITMLVLLLAWAIRLISGLVFFVLTSCACWAVMLIAAALGGVQSALVPVLGCSSLIGIVAGIVLARRLWRLAVVSASAMTLLVLGFAQLFYETLDTRIVVVAATSALVFGMISGALVNATLEAGAQADFAAALATDAAAAQAAASARAQESFRLTRLLHDGVINTLGTIRWGRTRDTELVRERCRHELRDIEDHWRHGIQQVQESDGLEKLVARAEDVARVNGISLIVRYHSVRNDVPGAVIEAMSGALTEALVNAGKHAGSDFAVLRIESEAETLRIALDDFGAGFAEDVELRTDGGVANSIHERCVRAGVESSLKPSGSNGVQLEMTWQRLEPAPEVESADFVFGPVLAVVATEIALWVIVRLVVGIPFDWNLAQWWWWLLMLVLICGGVAMGLISARRHFHISRPVCWAMTGLVAIIAAVPSPMADVCLEPGDGTWQAFGASVVAVTMVWLTPGFAWTAVATGALVAGWASELLVMYFAYGCSVERGAFLLIYPAGVLALWLVRRYLEAFGRHAHASIRELREIRETDSDSLARRFVRDRVWDSAVMPSLPLLREIADGTRDPDDSEVRAEAALRESLLRNCVQLDAGLEPVAGVILQACQQAADKDIGVTINYSQPPSADTRTLARISETLRTFVADAEPGRQVAITALGIGTLGSITCSAIDASDDRLHSAELTWQSDSE